MKSRASFLLAASLLWCGCESKHESKIDAFPLVLCSAVQLEQTQAQPETPENKAQNSSPAAETAQVRPKAEQPSWAWLDEQNKQGIERLERLLKRMDANGWPAAASDSADASPGDEPVADTAIEEIAPPAATPEPLSVVVYGTANCPACKWLTKKLTEAGVKHSYVILGNNEVKKNPGQAYPHGLINGEPADYERLQTLLEN